MKKFLSIAAGLAFLAVSDSFGTVWPSDGTVTGHNYSGGSVQWVHDNQAHDGDIITLPAGTFSWTSAVTISKAITLQGQGIGTTIILDSAPDNAPNPQSLLVFNTSTGQHVRLTGIEFRFDPAGRTTNFSQGLIQLKGSSNAVRVDHCKFVGIKNRVIYLSGSVFGVMDHCEIDNDANISGPTLHFTQWHSGSKRRVRQFGRRVMGNSEQFRIGKRLLLRRQHIHHYNKQ